MIHDLVLRWAVSVLFALSAAECGLALVVKRRPWTFAVSHALHFVMSVAMVAMAWPWGARISPTPLAVFFFLAAAWFVTMGVVAARTTAPRLLYGYYGLMMLATAWMYVLMNPDLLPARPAAKPGMAMLGMETAAMSGGPPTWFSTVNWVGTVGFAAATIYWTCGYFRERHGYPARPRPFEKLGQMAMAAGMTGLFVATLLPI